MTNQPGYRGYIGSRPYICGDFPQYVQNLIIRNYCQKHQLTYLLSATEYRMPSCYMILEEVVNNIESLAGIVLFSVFMLPESHAKRKRLYEKVLGAGKTIHAALEDLSVKNNKDSEHIEEILTLNQIALGEQSLDGLQDFVLA